MSPAELLAVAATMADAAARLAKHVAENGRSDAEELIPVAVAAKEFGTSVRTLNEWRRSGELQIFGKQRSRVVRRGDVKKLVESRRVRPLEGADDLDMRRRMARLEESRAAKRTA